MDTSDFPSAFFPSNMAGNAVKALIFLWNVERSRTVGTIVPKYCHPANRDWRAPGNEEGWESTRVMLRKMKTKSN